MKKSKLIRITLSVLFLLFFVVLAWQICIKTPAAPKNTQVSLTHWTNTQTGEQITLPYDFTPSNANSTLRLSTVLSAPKNPSGVTDSLYLYLKYCSVTIYLDGEFLYEAPQATAYNPGVQIQFVPLPEAYAGKTLEIVYTPSVGGLGTYLISAPLFGSEADIQLNVFEKELPYYMLDSLLLFVGVMLMFFASSSLKRAAGESLDLQLMAFFLLASAGYMISQLASLYIMLQNTPYIIFMEYTCLNLSIAIVTSIFLSNMNGKVRWFYVVLLALCAIAAIILIIVGPILNQPVRPVLPLLHFLLILCIIGLILALIFHKQLKPEMRKIYAVCLAPIVFGTSVSLVIFYILPESYNSQVYGLCMLVLLSLFTILLIRSYLKTEREQLRAGIYKDLALRDTLTGCGSRLAYEQMLSKLNTQENKPACICADLNNLKYTNDTSGHQEGDRLIRRASDLFRSFAEPNGTAFRIGGDEFTILYDNLPSTVYTELAQQLIACTNAYNNAHPETPLSFAFGIAQTNAEDSTIHDMITRADRNMYRAKEETRDIQKAPGAYFRKPI